MKTNNDFIDFGFDIVKKGVKAGEMIIFSGACACGKNSACQCDNEEKVKETLTKKENNAKSNI